jgi:hypothetical protein
VFLFALVTLSAEDSSYVADRHARYPAEVWTDEAFGGAARAEFRARAIRGPGVAFLGCPGSARRASGRRRGAALAPGNSAFARHVVAVEPAAAALVRDATVRGRPSEFALSSLADARPLTVELDPNWDRRPLEHLVPEPFWLGYSAHPLGRSDRALTLGRGRDAFRRVLGVANAPTERDPATLAALAAQGRAQAATLAALGDRESLPPVLADLKTIDPGGKFVAELERRLARHPRGGIELAGLVQ